MNPLKIYTYQLYLLQLENYELGRYFKLLFAKGFYGAKGPQRKQLEWTLKARLIFGLAWVLVIVLALFFASLNIWAGIIFFLLGLLAFPLYLVLAEVILMPLDWYLKNRWVKKAKKLIAENPDLKIVGIVGSYGKTTMKNVVATVLSAKLKVMVTPESVNTPVGIARWLVGRFKKGTEVLVIEMGEHYVGDIKFLCGITPPDVAIITGVNEAHFERLGSLEAATNTIFEIAEGAKKGAKFYLNGDDKLVKANYQKFLGETPVTFYGRGEAANVEFNPETLSWGFKLKEVGEVRMNVLGEYFLADSAAAAGIAKDLGFITTEIKKGITDILPVAHRLEPIRGQGNVLVIDDSYNGNFDGVQEAIKTLGRFEGRRKIYLTPGLVELGAKNAEVHEQIGKDLAKVAEIVILIKNSATPHIEKGLLAAGFAKENIRWFPDATSAHESLAGILRPGDVILFQNDWGDQYL